MKSKAIWLCCLMVAAAFSALAQVTPTEPATLNLTLGEQRVKFAPTRSFQEMRLEVVNSVSETVFTHTTTEAVFDWNLRASNNEALTPGLYRYALTLKFSEDLSRQHTGYFIVEKGQDQIWLTASDGAEVSGTTLNAARSGGRSIAGSTTAEDTSVKRDVSGRELVDEKGNSLADKQKNARSEKASLLGTAGQIAKFAANGTTLIDSVVTESAAGKIGIGTTTPDYKLDVEHGGGTGIRVKSTASFSVVDIDAFSGDAALRFMKNGTSQWNFRNDPSTDNLQIFELGGGGSRMVVQNTTGNLGIGTTSPNAKLAVLANTATPPSAPGIMGYFANANESNTFLTADAYGNSVVHSDFLFRRARGTMAAPLAVQTDDIVGQIQMRGYGATGFATTARAGIRLTAAENWSDTAQGAYLAFMTNPNGSANINVERMRLTDAGNLGLGTTAPTDLLSVNGTASKPGGGSWAVFSDERLKDIKGRYTTGWQALRKLQPIRFEYKADNALGLKNLGETIGFSAQAVAEAIPEAVSMTPQGYLQLNQDPILWTMLNAVKEQQAQIRRLLKNNRRLLQRVTQLERNGRKQ